VTLPHKEDVLGLTDQYDGPIREIGAANTLYRGNNGKRAANTDYDAAVQPGQQSQPDPAAGTDPSLSALAGRKVSSWGFMASRAGHRLRDRQSRGGADDRQS
jgi:hypothetical protein